MINQAQEELRTITATIEVLEKQNPRCTVKIEKLKFERDKLLKKLNTE